MPQITLSVPDSKLPLLHNVLKAIGIESNYMKDAISSRTQTKASIPKSILNSVFKKYFTWEYFSNELEFE